MKVVSIYAQREDDERLLIMSQDLIFLVDWRIM